MSRVGRIEPVSAYDAPGVIFSSLLDGEFTGETMRSAIFEPARLTPAERDTISTRLKEASGNNAISNTLIDIATNPWVWFMFLTSPAGGSALLRSGKGIFDIADEFTGFVRKRSPLLSSLGLTSPAQDGRGMGLFELFNQIARGRRTMAVAEGEALGNEYAALLKKTGLPHLDHERIVRPQVAERAKKLNAALHASLSGWDKKWTEAIPEWTEGKLSIRNVEHNPLVSQDMDRVLRQLGGDEAIAFRDATRKAMRERIATVFKDDDAVMRAFRLVKNPAVAPGHTPTDATGRELVEMIMGPLLEGVDRRSITIEQFRDFVQKVVREPLKNPHYMPRNLAETYMNGVSIQGRVNRGEFQLVKPGGFLLSRDTKTPLFHPDDLEYVANQFGGFTEQMQSQIAAGRALLDKTSPDPVRLFRINSHRSVSKYMDDTSRTYAFTQKPDKELLDAQRKAAHLMTESADPKLPKEFDEGLGGGKTPLKQTVIEDVAPDKAPLGGFSVADVLQQTYTFTTDQRLRERISTILIPRAMGRLTTQNAALRSIVTKGKEMAEAFVKTDAGKAIANAGPNGKGFMEAMDRWSKMEPKLGELANTSRWTAKWLYGTHLGFNPMSVFLNLTQPMLLASTWVGSKNVLKAYGTAIEEYLGYVGERASQGFRPLAEAERRAMYQKHFSLAKFGPDSEDLLGVAPNLFETIEGVTLTGARSAYSAEGLGNRLLFEYPMKMFQHAEILNRLVTGNAVLHAYRGAGKPIADNVGKLLPQVASDVRQLVQETQFGGDFLNTPWLFQSGGVLNNPLLRQFITFQLRTATGLAETSRRIGGRQGLASALGPFKDFSRMMGTSAIIYEAGKNMLGADLSRGLAFSAATDILPGFAGGRYESGDSLVPVPPIIDIPYSLLTAGATDDMALMRQQIPRLIPGGVAISRLLGGVGRIPLPEPVALQSQYVDWNKQTTGPDGGPIVPVFKRDGTLVEWQHPGAVVLRSFGADFGGRQASGDIDRFIVAQGDLIREYRTRAMRALLGGDMAGYQNARDEFKRRTGMPLVISKKQLDAHTRLREVPRFERALDRLPPEYRAMISQFVSGSAGRAGLPEEALTGEATAAARGVGRPTAFSPPPEAQRELERSAVAAGGPTERASFSGFEGY